MEMVMVGACVGLSGGVGVGLCGIGSFSCGLQVEQI